MIISDNGYLCLFTLLGGGIGIVAQIFAVKLQVAKDHEREIKEILSLLIANLFKSKEYWFLVAEYYYLSKFDSLVNDMSGGKNYQNISNNYNTYHNENEDYENYRLLLVDVQAEIRRNLARLCSLDNQLSDNIKKDIEFLNLSKWPVKDSYININETSIRSGAINRKSVSHFVNLGLNAKGGLINEIDNIILKIEAKI